MGKYVYYQEKSWSIYSAKVGLYRVVTKEGRCKAIGAFEAKDAKFVQNSLISR